MEAACLQQLRPKQAAGPVFTDGRVVTGPEGRKRAVICVDHRLPLLVAPAGGGANKHSCVMLAVDTLVRHPWQADTTLNQSTPRALFFLDTCYLSVYIFGSGCDRVYELHEEVAWCFESQQKLMRVSGGVPSDQGYCSAGAVCDIQSLI